MRGRIVSTGKYTARIEQTEHERDLDALDEIARNPYVRPNAKRIRPLADDEVDQILDDRKPAKLPLSKYNAEHAPRKRLGNPYWRGFEYSAHWPFDLLRAINDSAYYIRLRNAIEDEDTYAQNWRFVARGVLKQIDDNLVPKQ